MIRISVPHGRVAPLAWVAGIVLGEMLGIEYELSAGQATDAVEIASGGKRLSLASSFPNLEGGRDTWSAQMPQLPLAAWDVASLLPEVDIDEPLPVIFGHADLAVSEAEIRCGVDIFGSIFLMLSRFEEIALPDRDRHDRFPATASLAGRAGFLFRPVVDEYVEVLWAMMKCLWPGLNRRRRQGGVKVSCDVDQPFDRVGTSFKALVRSVAGDLGKRHDPILALNRSRNFSAHRRDDLRYDPYYNFDWYLDVVERQGHTAAFYFIADHSAGAIDGSYEIDEPRVLALMRKIAGRGHETGMHGSYNTFRNAAQLCREWARLRAAHEKAGGTSRIAGNRQHYLRWDSAQTPDHLDEIGVDYDTTGSFADRPGFRFGTSHQFPMWSWQRNGPLSLRQAPLVVMECSVLAEGYLGLGHTPEAFDLMMLLKRRALRYGGDFTLLWHNSELLTAKDREFFEGLQRQ